jgi:hypothetical protein
MKDEKIKCDNCKKEITFPAIIGLTATFRTRTGVNRPMGYTQFEVENRDFCDLRCLEVWVEQKHKESSRGYSKVDPWDRTDL